MTTAAAFAALVIFAGASADARPILDFNGGIGASVAAGSTFGWAFTVNFPYEIGSLGVFDAGADGLAEGHAIGLWTSGGMLIRSVVITTANSAPVASTSFDGNWRSTSIPPLTLLPGQYVIGATFESGSADLLFEIAAGSIMPGITFEIAKLSSGPGLIFPSKDEPGVTPGYFGPNLFTVPEPSSLLMFGTGLIGFVGRICWTGRKASRINRI